MPVQEFLIVVGPVEEKVQSFGVSREVEGWCHDGQSESGWVLDSKDR